MNQFLGWTLVQWARVLAVYGDYPTESIRDFLAIRHEWLKNHNYEPIEESIIQGVEVPYDFEKAEKIMNLCLIEIGKNGA